MTPELRYEALAAADAAALTALADAVLASGVPVEVVAGPEVASAPVRIAVPGTTGTTAVIGHVALTTCEVVLGGARGDGCRRGRDLAGAVAAAVCDAEVERAGSLAGEVEALVRATEAARARGLAAEAELVRQTRLDG